VRSRGHHELSVFGLMKDATIDELRGYIDQLLAHGLLQQSGDEYPILQISAEGHALLKNANAAPELSLARQKRPDRNRLPKRARVETEGWDGVDRELFEELRVLRLEIARRRRVPPYVIFHDTTLREIARVKPRTVEELRHVYGVGDRKANDLGELILSAVARATPHGHG
jgi:ATP-dependent DNA helicase RecQ